MPKPTDVKLPSNLRKFVFRIQYRGVDFTSTSDKLVECLGCRRRFKNVSSACNHVNNSKNGKRCQTSAGDFALACLFCVDAGTGPFSASQEMDLAKHIATCLKQNGRPVVEYDDAEVVFWDEHPDLPDKLRAKAAAKVAVADQPVEENDDIQGKNAPKTKRRKKMASTAHTQGLFSQGALQEDAPGTSTKNPVVTSADSRRRQLQKKYRCKDIKIVLRRVDELPMEDDHCALQDDVPGISIEDPARSQEARLDWNPRDPTTLDNIVTGSAKDSIFADPGADRLSEVSIDLVPDLSDPMLASNIPTPDLHIHGAEIADGQEQRDADSEPDLTDPMLASNILTPDLPIPRRRAEVAGGLEPPMVEDSSSALLPVSASSAPRPPPPRRRFTLVLPSQREACLRSRVDSPVPGPPHKAQAQMEEKAGPSLEDLRTRPGQWDYTPEEQNLWSQAKMKLRVDFGAEAGGKKIMLFGANDKEIGVIRQLGHDPGAEAGKQGERAEGRLKVYKKPDPANLVFKRLAMRRRAELLSNLTGTGGQGPRIMHGAPEGGSEADPVQESQHLSATSGMVARDSAIPAGTATPPPPRTASIKYQSYERTWAKSGYKRPVRSNLGPDILIEKRPTKIIHLDLTGKSIQKDQYVGGTSKTVDPDRNVDLSAPWVSPRAPRSTEFIDARTGPSRLNPRP